MLALTRGSTHAATFLQASQWRLPVSSSLSYLHRWQPEVYHKSATHCQVISALLQHFRYMSDTNQLSVLDSVVHQTTCLQN